MLTLAAVLRNAGLVACEAQLDKGQVVCSVPVAALDHTGLDALAVAAQELQEEVVQYLLQASPSLAANGEAAARYNQAVGAEGETDVAALQPRAVFAFSVSAALLAAVTGQRAVTPHSSCRVAWRTAEAVAAVVTTLVEAAPAGSTIAPDLLPSLSEAASQTSLWPTAAAALVASAAYPHLAASTLKLAEHVVTAPEEWAGLNIQPATGSVGACVAYTLLSALCKALEPSQSTPPHLDVVAALFTHSVELAGDDDDNVSPLTGTVPASVFVAACKLPDGDMSRDLCAWLLPKLSLWHSASGSGAGAGAGSGSGSGSGVAMAEPSGTLTAIAAGLAAMCSKPPVGVDMSTLNLEGIAALSPALPLLRGVETLAAGSAAAQRLWHDKGAELLRCCVRCGDVGGATFLLRRGAVMPPPYAALAVELEGCTLRVQWWQQQTLALHAAAARRNASMARSSDQSDAWTLLHEVCSRGERAFASCVLLAPSASLLANGIGIPADDADVAALQALWSREDGNDMRPWMHALLAGHFDLAHKALGALLSRPDTSRPLTSRQWHEALLAAVVGGRVAAIHGAWGLLRKFQETTAADLVRSHTQRRPAVPRQQLIACFTPLKSGIDKDSSVWAWPGDDEEAAAVAAAAHSGTTASSLRQAFLRSSGSQFELVADRRKRSEARLACMEQLLQMPHDSTKDGPAATTAASLSKQVPVESSWALTAAAALGDAQAVEVLLAANVSIEPQPHLARLVCLCGTALASPLQAVDAPASSRHINSARAYQHVLLAVVQHEAQSHTTAGITPTSAITTDGKSTTAASSFTQPNHQARALSALHALQQPSLPTHFDSPSGAGASAAGGAGAGAGAGAGSGGSHVRARDTVWPSSNCSVLQLAVHKRWWGAVAMLLKWLASGVVPPAALVADMESAAQEPTSTLATAAVALLSHTAQQELAEAAVCLQDEAERSSVSRRGLLAALQAVGFGAAHMVLCGGTGQRQRVPFLHAAALAGANDAVVALLELFEGSSKLGSDAATLVSTRVLQPRWVPRYLVSATPQGWTALDCALWGRCSAAVVHKLARTTPDRDLQSAM